MCSCRHVLKKPKLAQVLVGRIPGIAPSSTAAAPKTGNIRRSMVSLHPGQVVCEFLLNHQAGGDLHTTAAAALRLRLLSSALPARLMLIN
jgi:hypothetical protein